MKAPAKHHPVPETSRPPDLRPGHDEKNLAQFPFALLAKRPPAGVDTIEYHADFTDPRTGKTITRKVTISGAGKFGLPTAQDEDVLIALLYLTLVDKQPHELRDADRTVYFTRRQCFEILGWPDTGDYHERFKKALRRWKGVTIIYENWWDNGTGQLRTGESGFNLLDNYYVGDSRRNDKEQLFLFPDVEAPPREQCYIVWNKTPFASFQNGYVKKLDLDTFFGLPTAAAKRAYRYLDAELPGSGQREYDLQVFACEHVGLARSYKPSRLRDEVQKTVVVPLEQADVIESLPPKRRFLKRDSRYKVVFGRKQQEIPGLPEEPATELSQAVPAKEPPSPLIDELRRRKLGGKIARELVAAHPADYIQQKIDYFDYQLEHATLKNPAAWLRSAIQDDYGEPAGYLSREQRERQRQAAEENKRQEQDRKQHKAEAERLQKEREEAQKRRHTEHIAHLRASLSPAELQEIEQLAKIEAAGLFRKYFHEEDAHALDMRRILVDKQILKKFPLPEPPPAS
jgi:hypothetical protein